MGDPFVRYVRDPSSVTDDPTPDVIRSEIASVSRQQDVPASVIELIWRRESGAQANPFQEVGVNSAGYGGFFGLPAPLLGSARQQTQTVATLLRRYYGTTGSWASAVNMYNTGDPATGYGTELDNQPPGGGSPTPPLPPSIGDPRAPFLRPGSGIPGSTGPIIDLTGQGRGVGLPNPLDSVQAAIVNLQHGAAQALVAIAVIGVAVALGYSGLRKVLG